MRIRVQEYSTTGTALYDTAELYIYAADPAGAAINTTYIQSTNTGIQYTAVTQVVPCGSVCSLEYY